MKRDLLFVADRLTSLLDENRLAILTRQHGVKKVKQGRFARQALRDLPSPC
jgi:hypothetical protein